MAYSVNNSKTTLSSKAKWYLIIQTCLLPFNSICLGIAVSIVSPTIIDMTYLFKCNYEEYTKALMMKSLGIFFGSYAGGVAVDRYRRHINRFIFGNIFIFGLMSICIPWYPSLILLGFLYLILGLSNGCLSVAVKSYPVAIWAEKAPLPLYCVYVAYAMGQALGPIICQPFISDVDNTNSSITDTQKPSDSIYAPYVICGLISWVVALLFLGFSFVPVPEEISPKGLKPKSLREMFSLNSGNNSVSFVIFWIICLFIIYFLHLIRMNLIAVFLYPIAVESELKFTPSSATYLQTVYYISAGVSRVIFGLLSICISVKVILFIVLTLAVVAYTGLAFLGLTAQYMMWIWVCSGVFFAAPLAPTVIAWADRYNPVTGLVVAVTDTGWSVGEFTSTLVGGIIYQQIGGQAVLYFCFGCVIAVFGVIIVMQIFGLMKGDRFKRTNNPEAVDSEFDESTPLHKS